MGFSARMCPTRVWIAALGALLVLAPAAVRGDDATPEPAPEAAAMEPATAPEDYDPLFDDDLGDEYAAAPAGFPDPLENTNRSVFSFNLFTDKWVLDPLTRAYGWVFPGPVKLGIRNVFQNLGEPATTVNNLLQLEWTDAGISLSRFVVNSTVGIAGIFDPAESLGLHYHRSDFGQTLALAGTPSGAYLMLPLLGPNDVRDGCGVLADFTMHPLTWFLGPTNLLLYSIYGGGQGISTREEALPKLDALREGSVDYYAALRNAYYQNRQAEIWRRREDRRNDWDSR